MRATTRVLMVNWTTRLFGGAERYLEQSIAALASRGVGVALLTEGDDPVDRGAMDLPEDLPCWSHGRASLDEAARWKPTLVLDHGTRSSELAAALGAVAPVVVVSHNYLGTCISGTKTHSSVTPRACERTLGWPCLLHYYPNRCGGLHPGTMIEGWHRNRAARDRLRGAAGVLALSRHMATEYERHGVRHDRIRIVPPPVELRDSSAPRAPTPGEPWRIAFVGRFDALKGGGLLLDALPIASDLLGAPIHLSLVGDGPERERLEARAGKLVAETPRVSVRFTGWMSRDEVESEMARHHLLALPSVWPEPYGLVGLEAGAAGLPTVAFDAGGIGDWLQDGQGGVLVRERPRTGRAFARGLARALASVDGWRLLSDGARRAAREHSPASFADALLAAVAAWTGGATSGPAARAEPGLLITNASVPGGGDACA